MRYTIPYGRSGSQELTTDLPITVLEPNDVAVEDQEQLLKRSLSSPLGSESFESFLDRSSSLLLIVNDATRPTPTARVLETLQPRLEKVDDLRIIVATGAHRAPTEDEYRFILGNTYDAFRPKAFAHDARNDDDMEYLGTSSNGTEMYLNRAVKESDGIIPIGSVEPHYFAGYTGGRKSFLPGVASYRTIEMNHKHALSDGSASLALQGNPVHEDMADAMKVLDDLRIFSIQTVLTADHRIYAVTAGGIHESFDAAVERADEVFCSRLSAKADIVITVAPYPMDIDLYQSQKALDNGKLALKDGGVIIMVSHCRDGVGEDTFLKLLSSQNDPQGVMDTISRGYKLGYHKAAKMAQIGTWARMYAVMGLPDDILRRSLLEPFPDVQSAFDSAVDLLQGEGRKDLSVVLMPQGSLTVPRLK